MTTYYVDYCYKVNSDNTVTAWIDRATCPKAVPRTRRAVGHTLGEVEAILSRLANHAVGSSERVVICEGSRYVPREPTA